MRAVVPLLELELEVQLATDEVPVPDEARFEKWARDTLLAADTGGECAMVIRLVGMAEGARLNETWRHKGGATNVLAFPPPGGRAVGPDAQTELGDVVICLPIAMEEAKEQRKEFQAHLAHLIVHGTLHLLGYTHEGEEDAARMESLETSVLRGLGIADPYDAGNSGEASRIDA